MALINTLLGEMDDSQLQKVETLTDNEVERTTTVEYCLRDCDGLAHQTGIAQGEGCFCPKNVHRSVNMTLKQGIEAISTVEGF